MKEYGPAARPVYRARLRRLFLQLRFFIPLFLCITLIAACGSPATNATSTPTPTPKPTPTPAVPTISKALTTYKGHVGPVIGAAWSPDGTRIASCGNDGTVQVWDAQSGQTLWHVHIARYTFAVAWSPDGQTVAGGASDGSIVLLNATNGQTLATYLNQTAFIEGLAWSPDGKFLASGSEDDTVDVWDVATGKVQIGRAHV